MGLEAFRLALGAAITLFCIGLFFAAASSRLAVSWKKGAYRCRAFLCIAAAVCLIAIVTLIHQRQLPIYHVNGIIETAQVHAEGKGHRTYLRVRTVSGAEVTMSAGGISPYFHLGQHADIPYQGETGFVLEAHFLSGNRQEGIFQGTDTWPPYWWLLMGCFLAFAGIRKTKRNPEGAKKI